MKGNRLILLFILLAILIGAVGYFGIKYIKDKQVMSEIKEYIPQEEIADNQMRKAMVNLYFYNNESGELDTEARLIDAIDLLENPYEKLIQMLIDGPKSEKLKKLLPDGVILHNAKIDGDCVIVDMSIDILNYIEDKDLKEKMINSIVNTLTELTEVDTVRFLIDGAPNEAFDETYARN